MKRKVTILFCALLLVTSNLHGQLIIEAFEGRNPFNGLPFAGPDPAKVDYNISKVNINKNRRLVKEGDNSLSISWNLKQGEWCGYIIELDYTGDLFNASGFNVVSGPSGTVYVDNFRFE